MISDKLKFDHFKQDVCDSVNVLMYQGKLAPDICYDMVFERNKYWVVLFKSAEDFYCGNYACIRAEDIIAEARLHNALRIFQLGH